MDSSSSGSKQARASIEREILASYMMEPSALDSARVEPKNLRDPRHSHLLEVLVDLRRGGRLDSSVDLIHLLATNPDLATRCGGVLYVMNLEMEGFPARLPSLERAILETYHRDGLGQAATRVIGGIADGEETEAVDTRLRGDLDDLGRVGVDHARPVGELASLVYQRAEQEAQGQHRPYLRTGWKEWDDRQDWLGWCSEGVTIIAARSGMGKTSILNTAALRLAAQGVPVLLHGTETTAERRVREIAFAVAGVDPKRWAALSRWASEGTLRRESDEELRRAVAAYGEAAGWMSTLPLLVSGAGITVERLRREVSRHVATGRCGVLVVDYLQDFVESQGIRPGDKGASTTHVSRELKDCAATLGIPILVGAQVSGEKDGIERGGDVVPQLWDVQWSSSAHQDAEEVYAINRGDYWKARLGERYRSDKHGEEGVVDIRCRKRRVGALGTLSLAFSGPLRWVGEPMTQTHRQAAALQEPARERTEPREQGWEDAPW